VGGAPWCAFVAADGRVVQGVAPELMSMWLLRHGQSLGNVANDAARAGDVERLDLADRDMDVPLSDLGAEQANAFGVWLGAQPGEVRPDVVVSSPYQRSMQTANHVIAAAGLGLELVADERLREREFGVLDLLTHRGVVARFPDEAVRRDRLGKFYYRPPGGESWVDVALRLRSLRDSLVREYADRRVLLVTHEVPIIVMRYLVERLGEPDALELSRSGRLANCSLTTYERHADDGLQLGEDAWIAPLEATDTPVTDEPDAAVAPR
jgi:probable phosphoglycerate mutase